MKSIVIAAIAGIIFAGSIVIAEDSPRRVNPDAKLHRVWEWTSTAVGNRRAVKGGAWDSRRTDCRTEARGTGRDPERGYANVGFRVVREGPKTVRRRAGR